MKARPKAASEHDSLHDDHLIKKEATKGTKTGEVFVAFAAISCL